MSGAQSLKNKVSDDVRADDLGAYRRADQASAAEMRGSSRAAFRVVSVRQVSPSGFSAPSMEATWRTTKAAGAQQWSLPKSSCSSPKALTNAGNLVGEGDQAM